MRIIFSLFSLGAACYGLVWMNSSYPELTQKLSGFLSTGSFQTLEMRHTAEQIMQTHRKELLKSARHQFLEPSLQFYPYVLLEVKYPVSQRKTKEGVILWDLTDGEMVINTKQWDKTHGFGDCITAHTDSNEFLILKTLEQKGGSADRSALSQQLDMEPSLLDVWIESCARKKLIVPAGPQYRIHLENPKLKVSPATRLEERLVTKSYHHKDRAPKRFSLAQIERMTQAAFGTDFVIRSVTDLYLPVHCIVVQNPDGSTHSTHWNALNGKRLVSAFFN